MKLSLQQKGVGFAILAPLLYILKAIAVKSAPHAKLEFFVFFRFLFDLIILTPFFFTYKDKLFSQKLPLHFLRGILAIIAIYCSVYAVRNLALVDVTLLENTTPLFIPLIVWILYRQRTTMRFWLILFLGFSSVFFLLNPKLDILHLASLACLGTAIASGSSVVVVNALSKTDHPFAILFYFNIFGLGLAAVPFWSTWERMPSVSFFWPFLLISLFGVSAQYSLTRAYSLLKPHVAGSFFYFSVLFSALFGWLVWEETISGIQILGGGLLIGCSWLIMKESRRNALSTE